MRLRGVQRIPLPQLLENRPRSRRGAGRKGFWRAKSQHRRKRHADHLRHTHPFARMYTRLRAYHTSERCGWSLGRPEPLAEPSECQPRQAGDDRPDHAPCERGTQVTVWQVIAVAHAPREELQPPPCPSSGHSRSHASLSHEAAHVSPRCTACDAVAAACLALELLAEQFDEIEHVVQRFRDGCIGRRCTSAAAGAPTATG
jgi:hypothetical protein